MLLHRIQGCLPRVHTARISISVSSGSVRLQNSVSLLPFVSEILQPDDFFKKTMIPRSRVRKPWVVYPPKSCLCPYLSLPNFLSPRWESIRRWMSIEILKNEFNFCVSSLILPRLGPLMLELGMVMLLRLLDLKGFIVDLRWIEGDGHVAIR